MTAAAPGARVAELAAFGVDAGALRRFEHCFRQFKVPVRFQEFGDDAALPVAPFAGAVLLAGDAAEKRIQALRAASPHMLIYVVGPDVEVARVAHLGVNAAVPALTEVAICRAVQNTYLLLSGGLRRYARLPMFAALTVHHKGIAASAMTTNISGGGIAASGLPSSLLAMGARVTVRLALPGAEPFGLEAIVCRVGPNELGLQLELGPEQQRLKSWIEDFLS